MSHSASSYDKYLFLIWHKDQIEIFTESNVRNKISEFCFLAPLIKTERNTKKVVLIPYIRGFAYGVKIPTDCQTLTDNITNIVYTGIGCNKIIGVLIYIKFTDIKVLLNILCQHKFIKVRYDIAMDFFEYDGKLFANILKNVFFDNPNLRESEALQKFSKRCILTFTMKSPCLAECPLEFEDTEVQCYKDFISNLFTAFTEKLVDPNTGNLIFNICYADEQGNKKSISSKDELARYIEELKNYMQRFIESSYYRPRFLKLVTPP